MFHLKTRSVDVGRVSIHHTVQYLPRNILTFVAFHFKEGFEGFEGFEGRRKHEVLYEGGPI